MDAKSRKRKLETFSSEEVAVACLSELIIVLLTFERKVREKPSNDVRKSDGSFRSVSIFGKVCSNMYISVSLVGEVVSSGAP
ncbi:MAG: hypothetical protein ACTS6H_01340 [Candidatus Hodgkinia cicadicola]